MGKRSMLWKTDEPPEHVPLSRTEEATLGKRDLTVPEENMCMSCWQEDKGISEPVVGSDGQWECAIHGPDAWFVKKFLELGDYERHMQERSEDMNGKTGTQLQQWQSPVMVPAKQKAEMAKDILRSMSGIRSELGEMAEPAAQALAQLALCFDLNPFNQEIFAIPVVRQGKVVDFTPYVGIRGWLRASRRVARRDLDTDFIFIASAKERLSPTEVESRMAHFCPRCNGRGSFGTGDRKCYACKGNGKYAAKDVIAIKLPLAILKTIKDARDAGIDGEDAWIWGFGVWRPGENIPDGRDPYWVAEKRASVDALRRAFDLPFSFDATGGVKAVEVDDDGVLTPAYDEDVIDGTARVVSSEDVEDEAFSAADVVGLDYSADPDAFKKLIRHAVDEIGYDSPAQAVEILSAHGLKTFEPKTVDTITEILRDEMGDRDWDFDNQATGEEKYKAQQTLVECGYPQGAPQKNLLEAIYNKAYDWSDLTAGALHNLVGYAQRAHNAKEEMKALPECKSVDDYKKQTKEFCQELTKNHVRWQTLDEQQEIVDGGNKPS